MSGKTTAALRLKLPPPAGSRIRCIVEDDQLTYQWPPRRGIFAFLFKGCATLFCTCWLCVWAAGWLIAAWALIWQPPENSWGLFFWLCFWTASGLFVGYILYSLHRTQEPESVTLGQDTFAYSSVEHSRFGQTKPITNRPPRVRIKIHKKEIGKLTLQQDKTALQLLVSHGNLKIEMGHHLDDAETQWLEKVISHWLAMP